MEDQLKISVCICTCKRVHYLKVLLDHVNKLEVPANVSVKLIVVDNDPAKSGEPVINDVKEYIKFPLLYDFESQRGIPFTRNKAVSLVEADTDFVVFIDDDEYPDRLWLKELIKIQKQTNADLVQGPSIPQYVQTPPKWVEKGGFHTFDLYNLNEGDKQPHNMVATNNLLVRYSKLKQLDGPFDEKLGLIGCDDTDLGLNLHELGCKMIYTNKALVYEFIPVERTTVKWLMQRNYRSANTFWLLCRKKNIFNFSKLMIGAIARMLIGIVLLIPTFILSPLVGLQYYYKMMRLIVRGYAVINGLFGFYYEEYKVAYTYNK